MIRYKHLFPCLVVLLNVAFASGQTSPFSTLQNVVPPSPEAISFARQNFSDVNLYAGKLNYSIPVYTLSQNGINFPITLSYTGGGGIKVEEVASSVGLGWSLQYTGMITRSIKGRADDCYEGNHIGYIHLPGIDTTFYDLNKPDQQMYDINYSYGRYDAQPDLYFINAPGLSASFYINKFKQVVFVEKSDLVVKILFSGYTITGFEVKDLSGNTYLFNITETTKSVPLGSGVPSEYTFYDVSSWYLSTIKNSHGKVIFTFQYQDKESNHTKQLIRSPYQYSLESQQVFDEDNSTYTELYNKRPLLQKIITTSGEVRFVMSTTTRYDLAMDHSVDSIVVKNSEGKFIRKFNFDYSYFSDTGTIQEGAGQYFGDGDPTLRLKLDLFEVIAGGNPLLKETYSFVYNTSQLLPNRLASFAMDHWGYYNGATNTSWEAKHRVRYYDWDVTIFGFLLRLKEFGTANREPNPNFTQACILKEVITPTGGSHQFDYEGHTSNHPDLPNHVTTSISSYTLDEQKNYFTVDLIREPFAYVKVQALLSADFSIQYTLRDSAEVNAAVVDTLVMGDAQHTHMLLEGKYYIRAKLIGSHPDPDYNYGPRLIKDIETLIINKPVGGVRIKQSKLVDPISSQTLIRNYFYDETGSGNPSSLSTGTISRIPSYGYQHARQFYMSPTKFVNGYVRQLSSSYPLIATNGSYAGYSMVTIVDSDQLKSEYHFTTFNDFPEFSDGYVYGDMFSPDSVEIDGYLFEQFPFTPVDERDYYRGKLLSETLYKKEGTSYAKVSEKENVYVHNFGYVGPVPEPQGPSQPESRPSPTQTERIIGMVSSIWAGSGTGRNSSKSYFLYSGKYDLQKIIEKNYSYNGSQVVDSLVTETELEYGQSPWFRDSLFHYQVSKVVQHKGADSDITSYYYPYDWRYNNPEITVADTSFLRQLEKQNRIGMPFMEKKKNNGVHVVTTKNLYNTFNDDQLYPNIIQVKNGLQSAFEERISFNKYDTLGNLIEQQKTSDVKSVYLWDYRASYPVAQVVNADNTQIAYTSFEAGSKGNWSFTGSAVADITAPTGTKSYSLSSNITKSGLSTSATYIVSYWKKNGTVTVNGGAGTAGDAINGWTYYENKIINPSGGVITVAGTGATIDELRLYPQGAQMTTYTYEPLVGMTSSCDANNQITYYDYDSFNRLTMVKDRKRNILKRSQYNIKGQ